MFIRILTRIMVMLIIVLAIIASMMRPTTRVYEMKVYDELDKDTLIFDFDHQLDLNYWNITNDKFDQGDILSYFLPKNVTINNNSLDISIQAEKYKEYGYTSGLIDTKGKFEFTYGRVVFRMTPALGTGLISAVRLIPATKSVFAGIDILCTPGVYDGYSWTGVFLADKTKSTEMTFPKLIDSAIYEFSWTKDEISLRVDGKQIYTNNTYVPSDKMYLSISLTAVDYPAVQDLPAKLSIDYLTVTKERSDIL